jgi:hypothetical protein
VLEQIRLRRDIETELTSESLDKVNTALQEALKASPLNGSAFGSMTDSSAHRDELTRTNATYK